MALFVSHIITKCFAVIFSIYDEIGTSYLFDLDFDEASDSQQIANEPLPYAVDARYIGNVSWQ